MNEIHNPKSYMGFIKNGMDIKRKYHIKKLF